MFDYSINDNQYRETTHYTYICKKCIKKFKPPKTMLEEVEKVGPGSDAPCGCEDCSGDGKYFYDFNAIEDFFTIMVQMAVEGRIVT